MVQFCLKFNGILQFLAPNRPCSRTRCIETSLLHAVRTGISAVPPTDSRLLVCSSASCFPAACAVLEEWCKMGA